MSASIIGSRELRPPVGGNGPDLLWIFHLGSFYLERPMAADAAKMGAILSSINIHQPSMVDGFNSLFAAW